MAGTRMAWQHTPLTLPLIVSTVASSLVAGIAWRHREHPGVRWIVVLTLATAWWSVTYAISVANTGLAVKILMHKLMYFGIVIVPVAWLAFAVEYTGRFRPFTRREIGGLIAIPTITVVMIWTVEHHDLMFSSIHLVTRGSVVLVTATPEPWFWVIVAYSYLLIVVGTGLILEMAFRSEHLYWWQTTALVTATVFPWGAHALYATGVTGVWDLTALGFSATGTVLLAAVFRHRLLEIVPAVRETARDEVIESMTEAVLVVNQYDQLVDLNPAGEAFIDQSASEAIGQPLTEVMPTVAEWTGPQARVPDRAEFSMTVGKETRHYDVRIASLDRGYGMITGRIITIRDVTNRHEREQKLSRHRQRLEVLNRVLRHDIRNGMNVILSQLPELRREIDEERPLRVIEKRSEEILTRSESARQIESVISDEEPSLDPVEVVAIVEGVIETISREYPEVDLWTNFPEEAWVNSNSLLDSAIMNLIENAAEHNDADAPKVEVSVSEPNSGEEVEIRIADNGPGMPDQELSVFEQEQETPLEHSSGLGLWLTHWIIDDLGGDIKFADNQSRGTVVTVRLESTPPPNHPPSE